MKAGYVADVDYAVQVALIYGRTQPVPAEGVIVPLKEKVNRTRLRAILQLRANANDLPALDASVTPEGRDPGRPQAAHRHRDRRRRRPPTRSPTRSSPASGPATRWPSHRLVPPSPRSAPSS